MTQKGLAMAGSKVRVAVLGGGMGAMSAAFALTEIDPKGERYEITVHQLGWRLGGKTASGRNPEYGQRIEEHGLHVWSGMYDNSFTIMRIAYNALNRPADSPLATIDDAFKRQNQPALAQRNGQGWSPWPFWFQPDKNPTRFPGRDSLWALEKVMPSLAEQLRRLLAAIKHSYTDYAGRVPGAGQADIREVIGGLTEEQRASIAAIQRPVETVPNLLSAICELAEGLDSDRRGVSAASKDGIATLLAVLHRHIYDLRLHERKVDSPAARALMMIDLGLTIARGIIDNYCLNEGLYVLDGYDFREFLRKYPPPQGSEDPELSIADCPIVEGLYDFVFGYQNGCRRTPNLSACSAIQTAFRIVFTYEGAFFYKATAGFGDAVFTPIYQVLKSRGVKFCFFHKVTKLVPSSDGSTIDHIRIDQQAAVRPGLSEYQPLVRVKGIDCWPASTLWDQIQDGKELAEAGVNFEDYSLQRPPVARLELQRGQDFDQVILGISVGALNKICKPLIDQKQSWADMVSKLATTRTQALQLWVDQDVHGLGGPFVAPVAGETMGPIVTGYVPPFDTYSDMSQLLPAEAWPKPGPRSVAYFCGVMGDEEAPDDTELATAKAKENSRGWMTAYLQPLWNDIGQSADFRWDLLHAEGAATGDARFDQQYWRANISPSERYVLSLPGTLQYRLEPGRSGYSNLFLAGDWTKVPEINAGCVEVAAMSGLAAASALSGVTIPIICCDTLYRPKYLNFGGWVTLPPPPYCGNDTKFYVLSFKIDKDIAQRYLDKSFNRAVGRKQFKVVLDIIFLFIINSKQLIPAEPPFSEEGACPEIDIGFWLLAENEQADISGTTKLGWIPAFLLVDNPYAVAIGREVMGYPKYYANIKVPPDDNSPEIVFNASALLIRKFNPRAVASIQNFLTLRGSNIKASRPSEHSVVEGFRKLCADADPKLLETVTAAEVAPSVLGGLHVPVPVWSLKQVRSANGSDVANFQTLQKGPLILTALRQPWPQLLSGCWTLELGTFDSLPFVKELGLGNPDHDRVILTSKSAFLIHCNFTMGRAIPFD
jgi:uncharacterized protein with NAD-binding domain and iron-sulfur cluster